jgi:hypothetical protein
MGKCAYTVGYLKKEKILYIGNIRNASLCRISGFHLGIIETFALLGYYASLIIS